MSDADLKSLVVEELEFEPAVNAARIAEQAAWSAPGLKSVDDLISVAA